MKKEKAAPVITKKRAQLLLIGLLAVTMVATDIVMSIGSVWGTLISLTATLSVGILLYSTIE